MSSVLSENKDRFLELSQGVDKFSNNLRLSSEDYTEYLSISNNDNLTNTPLCKGCHPAGYRFYFFCCG